MNYKSIIFTGHSIQKIFERNIEPEDIEESIKNGEVIEEYKDDKPYPSFLILNFINEKPLHIVGAYDKDTDMIYIITSYYPDITIWDETFKIRRTK